ncbi:xanthine dehydrogenase family protein molybdopterin-binding subunit [Aliamphritea hakodatensis]|uniref:xanthine dehydrogenase family protein molybdopterin-binding subunit n=1 Tax=Aliamphritea hakodatensis TaxID=2895352 RepID=UPI0022FD7AA6|nr:xanthine dehydrogenase family protein molybdopterin-binding subunit [Aliamphritea hakodatensis]
MFNRHALAMVGHKASAVTTSRRGFLKLAGAGAGLSLAMKLPAAEQISDAQQAGETFAPNAFLRITPDNRITLVMKHLEMGQGTYTGLTTLVAEELDADWDLIDLEAAPADAARYKNLHWGAQGTGGSSAMANSFLQMREAGATARQMLINAAAEQWAVPAGELTTANSTVIHTASQRSATYGELADQAASLSVPAAEQVRLKSPSQFRLIGRKVSRKDRGKNNGTAIFTQDIQLNGMLTAVVAHPPRFGAVVMNFDAAAARQVKGVVDVVAIPSGVAVLAKDFWSAKTGRDKLQITWDERDAISKGSEELLAEYRQLSASPGLVARQEGDAATRLQGAEDPLALEFEFPYLAHAAMEPMNCVAKVTADGCEIWNGDQVQTMDQGAIAATLGLKPEQVKINTLLAGGSFGRRANPLSDYVLESVQIAKSQSGVPVKLVWTREDDMRAGYYRPLYLHSLKGSVNEQGYPQAWQQRIVGQSIIKGTAFEAFLVKDGIDGTSVEGAADLPYQVPDLQVELHTTENQVPVQWWRAVGHTHTAFSTEVFLDQLARKGGKDPYELRKELLAGHPRHLGVLKLAAEKAGWGRKLPANRGMGIAVHESFNSYVAEVAEVSVAEDGSFRVEKITCAVDCGLAINPDIIEAQMQGGIGYGLSAALMSEITLEDGQVKQSNFHDYQVLRMDQMPEIEVHIVPSAEPPTGVGEPGTPPVAPAVANALSAVTGEVYTRLPLPRNLKA